ncbi:MAG: hypothetical protein ACKO3N_12370 [Verrucomicrobiota bacterium]
MARSRKRSSGRGESLAEFVAGVCVRTGLTREQALRESLPWLRMLERAAGQVGAEKALMQLNAVLAAVAPGSLKNGDQLLRRIQNEFRRQAGL